jgi:hypothetical protein
MSVAQPSSAELNRLNAKFWQRETSEAERRSADPDLLPLALADLASDDRRLVPLSRQKSLEQALMDAEALLDSPILVRRGQRRLSLLGGKAKKPDALQCLIIKIVSGQPQITEKKLLHELKMAGDVRDVVEDIEDGTIYFVDGGRSKSAPISGLKDRLSRAKK